MLIKGKSQILFGSMGRLSENSVLNLKNKSHSVTAEIVVPTTGAEGVIVAQGGNAGGWSLYAKGGKLKYCYNLFGIQCFYAESSSALTPGDHQVRMEFAYAGGGFGKGGTASLYVDGKKVGEGKVAATEPCSSLPMMVATWGWTPERLYHRTMDRGETSFRVASRASSSQLLRTLRVSIISSPRKKLSASPWQGSKWIRREVRWIALQKSCAGLPRFVQEPGLKSRRDG